MVIELLAEKDMEVGSDSNVSICKGTWLSGFIFFEFSIFSVCKPSTIYLSCIFHRWVVAAAEAVVVEEVADSMTMEWVAEEVEQR